MKSTSVDWVGMASCIKIKYNINIGTVTIIKFIPTYNVMPHTISQFKEINVDFLWCLILLNIFLGSDSINTWK